jgi:hypothetical protein
MRPAKPMAMLVSPSSFSRNLASSLPETKPQKVLPPNTTAVVLTSISGGAVSLRRAACGNAISPPEN